MIMPRDGGLDQVLPPAIRGIVELIAQAVGAFSAPDDEQRPVGQSDHVVLTCRHGQRVDLLPLGGWGRESIISAVATLSEPAPLLPPKRNTFWDQVPSALGVTTRTPAPLSWALAAVATFCQ